MVRSRCVRIPGGEFCTGTVAVDVVATFPYIKYTYIKGPGALNKSRIGYETFNFNTGMDVTAAVAATAVRTTTVGIQVRRSSTLSFLCVILNG